MLAKEWGNATWYLFHALSYKLKQSEDNHAPELFAMFRRICDNLPCPDCREHATKIMARQQTVRSKAELEKFMWNFHNNVNRQTKKSQMSFEEYKSLYAKANTRRIINHFIITMRKNLRAPNMMLDSFRRQSCVTKFIEYIERNRGRFQL